MPGRRAAKFDTNIRALRGTVMGLPVTNLSTESDFYVGIPTGFNVQAVGVLAQDVVEPGYPLTSEMFNDPNSGNPINGSTPPAPFTSQGRAWGIISGPEDEVEVIAADTSIQAEDECVIADAYGRVTSIRNVAGGSVANVVGVAKYPPTAVNQRIRLTVGIRQRKV